MSDAQEARPESLSLAAALSAAAERDQRKVDLLHMTQHFDLLKSFRPEAVVSKFFTAARYLTAGVIPRHVWPSRPPADWFRDVQSFLKNPMNKKYSIQEFNLMLSRTGHVEYMYIEAFKALFPDAKRMKAAQFGDIAFRAHGVTGAQGRPSVASGFRHLAPPRQ